MVGVTNTWGEVGGLDLSGRCGRIDKRQCVFFICLVSHLGTILFSTGKKKLILLKDTSYRSTSGKASQCSCFMCHKTRDT